MLTLRVKQSSVDRIDAVAGKWKMSRSDAVRTLLARALDREEKGRG